MKSIKEVDIFNNLYKEENLSKCIAIYHLKLKNKNTEM